MNATTVTRVRKHWATAAVNAGALVVLIVCVFGAWRQAVADANSRIAVLENWRDGAENHLVYDDKRIDKLENETQDQALALARIEGGGIAATAVLSVLQTLGLLVHLKKRSDG